MNKTWKPIIAGVIGIIVGLLQVLHLMFICGLIELERGPLGTKDYLYSAVLISLALLAIVGGICHIFRTKWPLAMAGSIAVFLSLIWPFLPGRIYWQEVLIDLPGIVVIVLTVLSRKEFRRR